LSGQHAPVADQSRLREFLRQRFATPAAVYGLILFAVLLAVASDDHPSVGEVLVISVTSLLVFFLAHVFAHALGDHGELGLRRATVQAIHHSSGMLYASIPPTIVLIVSGLLGQDAESATDNASLAAVVVLGVLGYFAYAKRTDSVTARLVGAFGTAMLGALIMLLDYSVH
jgi:hypothetical protein